MPSSCGGGGGGGAAAVPSPSVAGFEPSTAEASSAAFSLPSSVSVSVSFFGEELDVVVSTGAKIRSRKKSLWKRERRFLWTAVARYKSEKKLILEKKKKIKIRGRKRRKGKH